MKYFTCTDIMHVYFRLIFPYQLNRGWDKKEFLYFHKNYEIINFEFTNVNYVLLWIIHIFFRKIISMDEIILMLKNYHKTRFFKTGEITTMSGTHTKYKLI